MSNSIENIKKYLTDFKKYNPQLITDDDISKFEITGDLATTTTETSINLGSDDSGSKTFKIQQILNNLGSSSSSPSNNTTIDFDDNGIMYFTINDGRGGVGTQCFNIMELFTKETHSNAVYTDPTQILAGSNENNYFDYYMRYKLLKLTINNNSGTTKSIYTDDLSAYQDGTNIKELYDFIVYLKNLNQSELSYVSYIHILKCFKYYYQMALIIMNYAFIFKIKTDLGSESAILEGNVVDVQTNIRDLIKDLVIAYAISPSVNKKTEIINLINLGHVHKTGYKYTFRLIPEEKSAFVTNSIYYIINSKIDLIYTKFSSIKNCFDKGGGLNAVVDIRSNFLTIFNCHTYFGAIRQCIADIKAKEATSEQVIIADSDVSKYKTYISALESFFNNIYILVNTTNRLTDRIAAIEIIEKYIDKAGSGTTENDNLIDIKDLIGGYDDEKYIARQIDSIEPDALTNAKDIITTTSASPTPINLNIDSSTPDNSDFIGNHLGLTFYEKVEIVETGGKTVSNKKYYIADNVSNITINGVSVHNSAGDPIETLKGVKYYTKTTRLEAFQHASNNNIQTVTVPRVDNQITYLDIKITHTVSVPAVQDGGSPTDEEQTYLYITLILQTNEVILNNKIDSFKTTNSNNFENIFSKLFNAFGAGAGSSVITTGKFGYALNEKLTAIRDKYKTDTTSEGPDETIVDILFSDLNEQGASSQERARFKKLGNLNSASDLPDAAILKFSLTSTTDDLKKKDSATYNNSIKDVLTSKGSDDIKEVLNNYFNYHDKKTTIDNYLCKVAGSEGATNQNSASSKIKKYIEDEEDTGCDFDITANSNQDYTDSKDSIKDQNNLYKENVDKYKTKNNELNNILKNNLYNNIFLYITIVVLILICFGLIYINNHKASLKTQYSVMLIAFLLLYYIIYTNIVVNVTEPFLSGCSDSSNNNKYSQEIINLHSKITSFLSINIYDKNKSDDINESLNKEKNKYTGFAKSSNSKLNSLELVLNDEFINAIKSKELVKFLILFTAICIISYIVYTNTEDPTTTSIIFIILFVIILMIYFYNINLMTRTKADNKYWNHQMVMK